MLKLITLIEAAKLLTNQDYVLRRIYSKRDGMISIKYSIYKNESSIIIINIIGDYDYLEDLIDIIEKRAIVAFIKELSNEIN